MMLLYFLHSSMISPRWRMSWRTGATFVDSPPTPFNGVGVIMSHLVQGRHMRNPYLKGFTTTLNGRRPGKMNVLNGRRPGHIQLHRLRRELVLHRLRRERIQLHRLRRKTLQTIAAGESQTGERRSETASAGFRFGFQCPSIAITASGEFRQQAKRRGAFST